MVLCTKFPERSRFTAIPPNQRAKIPKTGGNKLALGVLTRWLGGIAVNRARSGNLVQSTIDAFHSNENLTVIVPPEGTRRNVSHWKTGFYHIAHGAGVPVALGYLDFKRKAGGIGAVFYTTGDIAKDMQVIQEFYDGIKGKNPRQFDSETIKIR